MPFLGEADPRKPKNRAIFLYRCFEQAGLIGAEIPRQEWTRILVALADADTLETQKRLRRKMEAFGMLENHAGPGVSGPVTILPNGLELV